MYQGIAKVHKPNWFPEDREKLEKVLLELWPNSKINPRKMYYYIENCKAFYPEIVHEAIGRLVSKQEYDRRPTINQLRKECQLLVSTKHKERHPQGESKEDCAWCGYQTLVHVGLYIESPEKCTALDITGKNVLVLPDGWAVRPDWGKELELNLEEYMVHCPHCSHPQFLKGYRSALNWERRFGVFTEFRCSQNGNTDSQWHRAWKLYNRMTSHTRPNEETFDTMRQDEQRFHEYLASLPTLGEFEDRRMNVVDEEPQGEYPEWRKEEENEQQAEAAEGEILPPENEGLS